VRQELAPGPVTVAGDRGQLEQVVLNLVVNAEHAVAAGRGERALVLRTAAVGGSGVTLQVADTGQGMDAALMERIFDPFFTTKPPGEGSGLGLSLVARIVAEHAGEVRVESTPGKGTTFTVELPAAFGDADPAVARPAPQPAAAERPVTPLRVLVVDDEAPVRRVVARFLERRGHVVHQAAEGAEALAMVDAAGPEGYSVILSDLRMPGLGGDQLLERLRARGDGMDQRLVLLTGDTASPDAGRILRNSDVPVLEKPIDMNELARELERITRHTFTVPEEAPGL
jgi:CheY-like chemotaxis protein/anti-sigma regulatory factor (Ser/Thr protein kinase)